MSKPSPSPELPHLVAAIRRILETMQELDRWATTATIARRSELEVPMAASILGILVEMKAIEQDGGPIYIWRLPPASPKEIIDPMTKALRIIEDFRRRYDAKVEWRLHHPRREA